jgi:hypothetical protein
MEMKWTAVWATSFEKKPEEYLASSKEIKLSRK